MLATKALGLEPLNPCLGNTGTLLGADGGTQAGVGLGADRGSLTEVDWAADNGAGTLGRLGPRVLGCSEQQ